MEFPQLGKHCCEKTCNILDFLPMKCDACSNIFCKDHIQYTKHDCENAYQKDVQVPVCPLCNSPVPSKRGEQPDIAVGEHMDRDCQSDPAIANRKIYTIKCAMKGCKQKEFIPLTCNTCRKNYCLKHRHSADHKCKDSGTSGKPLSQAGAAALARAQNFMKSNQSTNSSSKITNTRCSTTSMFTNRSGGPLRNVQAGMSEDEALALALHKSMSDNNSQTCAPSELQEEEDRLLAQALAASEIDNNSGQQAAHHRKEKNCTIS